MFREKYKTYINWGVTVVLILCAAIAFYFILQRWSGFVTSFNTFRSILEPISTGVVIAYILESLVATISVLLMRLTPKKRTLTTRRLSVYRAISIVLSELIFIAIILALITSIVPQLIDSLRTLITNYEGYSENIETWARPFLDEYPEVEAFVLEQFDKVQAFVTDFLKNDLLSLISRVGNWGIEFGSYIYNFIIGLIVSIYLLLNKNRLMGLFKKLLYSVVKVDQANRALAIANQTNKVFRGFIVGRLLDSTIVGILCFIGCMALGIPYTLLISIIVGVTNVIPYFGPIIGAVPSILLVLMIDPIKALILAIFILVLQQLDGNVIGPRIVGGVTGVSSLGVLVSVIIGGGLMGITGMIVCVPLYSVIYSLIKRSAEKRLKKRSLPLETAVYVDMEGINPETGKPIDTPVPLD